VAVTSKRKEKRNGTEREKGERERKERKEREKGKRERKERKEREKGKREGADEFLGGDTKRTAGDRERSLVSDCGRCNKF
jgi:hypothetical protein